MVVTGGAGGIGRALGRRFHAEGARAVVLADLAATEPERVAAEIEGAGAGRVLGLACNVTVEPEVVGLIARTEEAFGPIDLFCANAGIGIGADVDTPAEEWRVAIDVNVMAHVYAARHLLPGWVARGSGYFLSTASAAGLLTQISSAPYAVTKHAAVAFAEWVSIHYGERGVKVSCLCPQGVNTAMLQGGIGPKGDDSSGAAAVKVSGAVLEPDQVADAVIEGLRDERFLILPHPEVLTYWRRKTDDYDRWLAGMRRLHARVTSG